MLHKLKNLFSKKPEPVVEITVEPIVVPIAEPAPVKVKKPRKPKEVKVEKELTAKEKATLAGEPYVNILSMEVDPDNINAGSFELDWNEKFILNLSRVGYQMKENDKESDIIDRWFQSVCRNVALEVYEQAQADPENRDLRKMNTKDLGNGRTEVS
jgi:hypothetical protein